MRRKLLIALAVLLFLIVAGVVAELVLTSQAEGQLSSIVQKKFNLPRRPEVEIVAHPLLFKLYKGQIDYIQINASDVTYEQFKADQITIKIKNLQFDSSEFLSRRQLLVEKVDQGLVKIVISEAEVNKYIQEMVPGSRIKLERGELRYLGSVTYFGETFTLDVKGKVAVSGNQAISFFPDVESIKELTVPDSVKTYLTESLLTQIMLPDLPVVVKLLGAKVEPGRLTINAQITDFGLL